MPPGTLPLQQARASLEAGNPEQALQEAHRAIREAAPFPSSLTIEDAAGIVLAAFLHDVHDLDGLQDAFSGTERYLEGLSTEDARRRDIVGGHLTQIAAARVQLHSGTQRALTRLCSLLRKAPFHRPDLAVLAADAALAKDPNNGAALTTKGAALLDLGKLHEAQAALDNAWQLNDRSAHAAVTLCRLHIKSGWTTEALRWGETAVEIAPASEAAQRMYAAAQLAAGELLSKIDLGTPEDEGMPTVSMFDAVEAARQLAREGRAEEASRALAQLVELDPTYFPAVQALTDLDN